MISFTSDFIPRLVYLYMYSENGTMHGFVNHTLSYFNVSDFQEGTAPNDNMELGYPVQICRYIMLFLFLKLFIRISFIHLTLTPCLYEILCDHISFYLTQGFITQNFLSAWCSLSTANNIFFSGLMLLCSQWEIRCCRDCSSVANSSPFCAEQGKSLAILPFSMSRIYGDFSTRCIIAFCFFSATYLVSVQAYYYIKLLTMSSSDI